MDSLLSNIFYCVVNTLSSPRVLAVHCIGVTWLYACLVCYCRYPLDYPFRQRRERLPPAPSRGHCRIAPFAASSGLLFTFMLCLESIAYLRHTFQGSICACNTLDQAVLCQHSH